MSTTRILTLFGEEIVNEPAKPAAKSRVRSKDALLPDEEENELPSTDTTIVISTADAVAEAATTEIDADALIDNLHNVDAATVSAYNEIANKEAEDIYTDVLPDDYKDTNHNSSTEPSDIVQYDMAIAQYEKEFAQPTDINIEELPNSDSATEIETPRIPTTTEKHTHTSEDIIPEDWTGEKKYYTIGEVADFFKVKTSHIRFWTNEFKLKVRTTRKGDRLFTPEQVKELRAIYHLTKERGFTISGAKAKLKTKNNMDVTTVDLKTSLVLLKSKLIALRKQLG